MNCYVQYFTDVIVAAGKNGTSAEELNDFKTAHDLIKELNRTAPGLLLNVIPQLEEELKVCILNNLKFQFACMDPNNVYFSWTILLYVCLPHKFLEKCFPRKIPL
jgi:hypothetical protein